MTRHPPTRYAAVGRLMIDAGPARRGPRRRRPHRRGRKPLRDVLDALLVDAFPDTPLTGTVQEIQRSTAGALAPLPAASSTADFQKITQVVPVRVAITAPRGLPLLPGMNVAVRIHPG